MSPQPENNGRTAFTHHDRDLITQTAAQTREIYNCLFGCPDNPTKGLFHLVNINTRFRQNMTKLLWVLIPIIVTMGLSLLTILLSN